MAGAGRASTHLVYAATLVLALVSAHVPVLVRAQDDTLAADRPLSGDAKLVSRSGKFALGFFPPDGGVSGSWYIGIWFNNIAVRTPVWVANRDRPVSDPASSRLTIAPHGDLVLLAPSGSPVWSTNATATNATTVVVVAVLLDTGNLVLAPASNVSAVLWQSFDHIGDTWLAGAKLRRDKATGVIQGMTSWRARGDPAPGMYTLQLDPAGAPQYVLRWNGTLDYWLTGDWNGRFFTNAPEVAASSGGSGYSFQFVDDARESYFTYNFANNATVYRFVADVSGQVKGWFWVPELQQWNLVYAEPKQFCAVPRGCGAFGVCSPQAASGACGCAKGFTPRDAASWDLGDCTAGCVRNAELQQCAKNNGTGTGSKTKVPGDRFFRMDGMRLLDDGHVVTGAASSGECEMTCLGDCTCTAYAYNGSCVLWNGDLQNMANNYGGSQADAGTGGSQADAGTGGSQADAGTGSLYLRLAASEFSGGRSHKRRIIEIAIGGALAIVVFSLAASILIVRTTTARRRKIVQAGGLATAEGCVTSFTYRDLRYVTKNFSDKLGGGAFGSVFQGQLADGTAVAVKKLEGLRQGEKQFRAEVSTLGTIQHVNLIHLLGFCSGGGDRKLLVYEYMPNGSLDRHLFGGGATLSWRARYRIAVGVAKGLAYLHDKCRDCIIHCDVKPENILLDADLAPKVADFGLAKLVGRDFSRVLTTVRGTIGYLAPEWISGEAITVKADVFSYGMMLFENVSGRRNVDHGKSSEPDSSSSSTGAGNDDRASAAAFFPLLVARRMAEAEAEWDVKALLDKELGGDANIEEVSRVCKVACWCIQHDVDERPTMAEVVQALEGLTDIELPPVPRYMEALTGRSMHQTQYITKSSRVLI